jgi:acetyl esterase/lipase
MITDWDDAYTNGAYIEGGDSYPARWQEQAADYRARMLAEGRAQLDIAYGAGSRQRFDRFLPRGEAVGELIFVHGGYWLRFDRSYWSHLAEGAVQNGWSVAMPSYTLAPESSVGEIAREVSGAVQAIAGGSAQPLVLAGHSAGGHLVTRMACADALLPDSIRSRIRRIMSISGLHDLRPLLRTAMGAKLFRTADEAAGESPALLEPARGLPVACWVGSDERPEFLRQNDLLANIWHGLGADMTCHHAKGRHHFDVIEDLAVKDSGMLRLLLAQAR